jgi:alpha/beta superfamily hydrolase
MMRPSSTEQTVQEWPVEAAEVQAYIAWLEEREAVRDAYERWTGGSSWGAALAFGAYRDALDREELASRVYETIAREVAIAAPAAAPVTRLPAPTLKGPGDDERDARPHAA